MLWVLFLACAALLQGFALKAAVYLFGLSPMAALHAFTYGGIGLFTLGMMACVTLGHTGRNIREPPAAVTAMFVLLVAGALVRVLLPLLDPLHYQFRIVLAGCLRGTSGCLHSACSWQAFCRCCCNRALTG
jgi:uncharacterized protein involved in response to NO